MDRTDVFETSDVGSIPAGRTSAYDGMAYVLRLERRFWGFESSYAHQESWVSLAETRALLKLQAARNRLEGSNPSLSAILRRLEVGR